VAVPLAWTEPGAVCPGKITCADSLRHARSIQIGEALRMVSSSFKYNALVAECRLNIREAIQFVFRRPFTEIYGNHRNLLRKLEFNRAEGKKCAIEHSLRWDVQLV
jgi:hypothetical protein